MWLISCCTNLVKRHTTFTAASCSAVFSPSLPNNFQPGAVVLLLLLFWESRDDFHTNTFLKAYELYLEIPISYLCLFLFRNFLSTETNSTQMCHLSTIMLTSIVGDCAILLRFLALNGTKQQVYLSVFILAIQ